MLEIVITPVTSVLQGMIQFEGLRVGDRLHMIGGVREDGSLISDLLSVSLDRKNIHELQGLKSIPNVLTATGHTATALGSKIFVIGGQHNLLIQQTSPFTALPHAIQVTVIQTTDPVSVSRVTATATDPIYRECHTCVAYQSNIVMFGGKVHSQGPSNELFLFRTVEMKWERPAVRTSSRASRPIPRYGHCAVASDSKMIVFGGNSGTELLNDILVLDMEKFYLDRLETVGTSPCPRQDSRIALVRDWLAVIGGIDQTGERLADLHLLATGNATWTTPIINAPIPLTPVAGHALFKFSNALYVVGGCKQSAEHNAFRLDFRDVLTTKMRSHSQPVSPGYPDSSTRSDRSRSVAFPPHTPPNSVVVKVSWEEGSGIMSKFTVANDVTLEQFIKNLPHYSPFDVLTYRDSDGDECTISSDPELALALHEMSGKVMRVTIKSSATPRLSDSPKFHSPAPITPTLLTVPTKSTTAPPRTTSLLRPPPRSVKDPSVTATQGMGTTGGNAENMSWKRVWLEGIDPPLAGMQLLLSDGLQVVGRNTIKGIDNPACSKRQLEILLNMSERSVIAKRVGVNSCYRWSGDSQAPVPMPLDQPLPLKVGDIVGLLRESFRLTLRVEFDGGTDQTVFAAPRRALAAIAQRTPEGEVQ